MLLTIHNLPSSTRYADVKSLLLEKCGLTEIIVDNLVNEGKSKKVTVGLASEDDGAFVVRKLNGLFINGQQLYIEDRRRNTADQPYRPGSFEPSQPNLQPAMAPASTSWNQNAAAAYMQQMPIPQTAGKSERNDGPNWNTQRNIQYDMPHSSNYNIPSVFKHEPARGPMYRDKNEFPTHTNQRNNYNPQQDFKPNYNKFTPKKQENNPYRWYRKDAKPETSKTNEKDSKDVKNIKNVAEKEESDSEDSQEMSPVRNVTGPKVDKKANSKARRSGAKFITKQIMRRGRETFRSQYGNTNLPLDKRISTRMLIQIHARLRELFGEDWKVITDFRYICRRYEETYGYQDDALYLDCRLKGVKAYNKNPNPQQRNRKFQKMVHKVKQEMLEPKSEFIDW